MGGEEGLGVSFSGCVVQLCKSCRGIVAVLDLMWGIVGNDGGGGWPQQENTSMICRARSEATISPPPPPLQPSFPPASLHTAHNTTHNSPPAHPLTATSPPPAHHRKLHVPLPTLQMFELLSTWLRVLMGSPGCISLLTTFRN